jgi:hypothetical protein
MDNVLTAPTMFDNKPVPAAAMTAEATISCPLLLDANAAAEIGTAAPFTFTTWLEELMSAPLTTIPAPASVDEPVPP